ncbi:cation:proton antiporter [uncultured Algimonas sp.]|uniref:cation:proton antiporter domain-containing protein n=1 Tax=uncultured Algimonas sp. TaxID=1547920 RepID=UPI00261A1C4A|nr:cation:proton antiporter [uncultured Algimonas sp.]
MTIEPYLGPTALALAIIFATGLLLHLIRQPHVIAYVVAGVLLGHSGLGLIENGEPVERLGALGVTLLLFFVGMETQPSRLIRGWRVSVAGTLMQIGICVALSFGIGQLFAWPAERALLLGFVISLSSTAVALKLLEAHGLTGSQFGQDTIGVLVVQDIAAIGMIIALGIFVGGGAALSPQAVAAQLIGGLALIALIVWIALDRPVRLPFADRLTDAPELQVFGALTLCFGLGWLSSALGLSTALGAFAGGLIVGAARATQWASGALAPFRTVFLGLFFVSVGLLLDLSFIAERILPIALLVALVLLSSMVFNSLIYRVAGYGWRQSVYAGALLAQPGEFSFVLTAIGATAGIITGVGYQMSLSVIALSLALSPLQVELTRRLLRPVVTPP